MQGWNARENGTFESDVVAGRVTLLSAKVIPFEFAVNRVHFLQL